MRKESNNKSYKGKPNKWIDNPHYNSEFMKQPEKEGSIHNGISTKSMKDLPKSSYSVKADPYTASNPVSNPYAILSEFLKTVGGNYKGDDNIDGGNVQQYSNSVTSKFLSYFDSFRMRLKLNYRYLPMTKERLDNNGNYIGKSLTDEMRKSIAEAVSVLQSTTFTSLAINNFGIITDMPLGSATPETIDGQQVYTDITDVLTGMSLYYQIMLQEGLSVMNAHNSFRLKQGTAIRDAWGREVPYLNAFFGLMNKSAFLSLLDSINLSYEGEYIDTDFMQQVNYLSFMPSRRSNSITDPVLELQVEFNKPTTFKVVLLDADNKISKTLYDDASLGAMIDDEFVPYWEACSELKAMLSLQATKKWARASFADNNAGSDNARYNRIKRYFDVLIASFVYFKPRWADFRECFDIMTRTGTISWTKGFRPSVVKDNDAQLFHNLIVDDIFKLVMSGNDELDYNDLTKRWTTYSQWNMYYGIPEYDAKQGGCFITFSSKNFSQSASGDEQITYLPIMFDPSPSESNIYVEGVNREGRLCYINYAVVQINGDSVLSRLAPLNSQSGLKIRIPRISSEHNAQLTNTDKSTLNKTLTQIFGLCQIDGIGSSAISLDPDIIAIYQIEISDITNQAITYSRANAPFRGTTSDQGLLGFFGVSK